LAIINAGNGCESESGIATAIALPQITAPPKPPIRTTVDGPNFSKAQSPENLLTIMASENDANAAALRPLAIPILSLRRIAPQSLADPSAIIPPRRPRPIHHKIDVECENNGIFAEVSSSPPS